MDGMGRMSGRRMIAYHEAGHAVVGHHAGLTFGVIYLGDVGGQVLFDAQWSAERVVRDAALLDRYGLMLLASAYVEQHCAGAVVGAESDIATMERMVRAAVERGTRPRPDLWQRAERQVDEHWTAIGALADELDRWSTPVGDLAGVLARCPDLGRTVDELTGARARELMDRPAAEPPADDGTFMLRHRPAGTVTA